jgi:hypothetical protein
MDVRNSRGKILRGTEGIGTVTPQMVEERSREIARSDGQTDQMISTGPARGRT